MTDLVFSEGISKLEAAFRCPPLSEISFDIYWRKLMDIDDETWREAVEEIIDTEDFFPSIACIRRHTNRDFDAAGRELKYETR